jgi:hypothetical protein
MEKPSEIRLENIDMDSSGTSNIPATADLKITRDPWRDKIKGVLVCLVTNITTLEYGLDQGMVNGFQAMPRLLKDFGYVDSTLPSGYGISTTVQQLITIPLEYSFQSSGQAD